MNNSFYFDHDYNARNDLKILQLRSRYKLDGYGLFWMIIEVMAEQNGYIKREALGGLSLGFNLPLRRLTEFIEYCIEIDLFTEDDNGIYSQRILQHLNFRQSLRDAGRRGGRGNKSHPLATLKPPLSQAKATPQAGKERKGKDIRKEIHKEIMFSDDFISFWSLYPKKIAKDSAWKSWIKTNSKPSIDVILSKLKLQIQSPLWQKDGGQYIPYPSTYINQKRWEDELTSPIKIKPSWTA